MLLVVLGAGASYDSAPSFPASAVPGAPDRMPLSDQLFEDRADFVVARSQFRRCLPIVPFLLHRKNQASVEQVLQGFQSEAARDSERGRQLAAIRYYLHFMLRQCQEKWEGHAAGVTNYITLLDQIRHWLPPGQRVCIVTFNYDTMIEHALETVGVSIRNLSDYVKNESYKLFKLHGSINWGRDVNLSPQDYKGYSSWQLAYHMIDTAEKLKFGDAYRISDGYPITGDQTSILFPAIAIPLEDKASFECPTEHISAL
jgi:hypothetical protein